MIEDEKLANYADTSLNPAIEPEEESLQLERYDLKAPHELKLLSWSRYRPFYNYDKRIPYIYDDSIGQDTFLYVIDQGINQRNPVRGVPTVIE